MGTIDDLARGIARDLSPQFEERLRAELAGRDREWLIDELVRLTLARHRFDDLDRDAAATALLREQRLERVRGLRLNHAALKEFIADNADITQERLMDERYLPD